MERAMKKKLQYALAGLFLVGMLIIIGTSEEKWMDKTTEEAADKVQKPVDKPRALDDKTDERSAQSTGARTTGLSINSTMGDILADERAKAILDNYMPGFSSSPQLQQAMGMSLKQLGGFMQGAMPDEMLEAIDEELSELSQVPGKDVLSEQGPTAVAAAANLRKITAVEAKDIMEAHIKAVGGSDAIAKIKTIRRAGNISGEGSFGAFSGTVEEIFDLSNDRGYTSMSLPGYVRKTGWSGNSGWVSDPQAGVSDMPAEELLQAKSNSGPSPLAAIYAKQGAGAFKEAGEGEFNGKKCTVVKAEVEGSPTIFYINQKTKLLAGMSIPGNGEMTFENHKAVNGVQFAGKSTVKNAAQSITTITEYNTTEVNGEIDTTKFKRP